MTGHTNNNNNKTCHVRASVALIQDVLISPFSSRGIHRSHRSTHRQIQALTGLGPADICSACVPASYHGHFTACECQPQLSPPGECVYAGKVRSYVGGLEQGGAVHVQGSRPLLPVHLRLHRLGTQSRGSVLCHVRHCPVMFLCVAADHINLCGTLPSFGCKCWACDFAPEIMYPPSEVEQLHAQSAVLTWLSAHRAQCDARVHTLSRWHSLR